MDDILSKVGVGSATVDTVFPRTTVTAGEAVDVRVDIDGGESEQTIDGIYFVLAAEYRTEDERRTAEIASVNVTESLTIGPEDSRSMPATLRIPRTTPITSLRGSTVESTAVWLETGLDIDWAVDPEDRDVITVQPPARVQRLLEALDRLGFRFVDVEYWEPPTEEVRFDRPLVQEFEFRPRGAPFAGEMETLEVSPLALEDECRVYLAVDRHTDIVRDDLRADESGERLSFSEMDVQGLRKLLRSAIRKHVGQNPTNPDMLDQYEY